MQSPLAIQRVKVNDVQFAYFEIGKGPLVLCLHGFPDTAHSFFPLMQILARNGYRVVAPFMRGYFPTDKAANGDYSVLSLARDVLGFIDVMSLGDEPVTVIGHDWGAFAAYAAANLEPEKFRALIQMSVGHMAVARLTFSQLRKSWYVWLFQVPKVPEKKIREHDFAFIDKLYAAWSPNWNYQPGDVAQVKRSLAEHGGVEAALAYYRSMVRGVKWKQIQLLRQKTCVPTLVIAGEADGSIGIDQYRNIASAYSGHFRFMHYPGIGHFPHRENATMVADDILDFLHQLNPQ